MMMTYTVERLRDNTRPSLVAHFLALPLKDRSLRFGMALAPTVIAAYVDGIDFERDLVFGVRDDRLAPVGVAHLAIEGDLAELALSVLPANRRRGIGSALFRRAVSEARARCIPGVCMHCLSGNTPVMRIAHRFGMGLITSDGDAAAYLNLQSPPPAPIALKTEAKPPRSKQLDLLSQWLDISSLRDRQRTQH
jgi:GNAT superfamily N-acetyltransferase